jgi:hypothetical protein
MLRRHVAKCLQRFVVTTGGHALRAQLEQCDTHLLTGNHRPHARLAMALGLLRGRSGVQQRCGPAPAGNPDSQREHENSSRPQVDRNHVGTLTLIFVDGNAT